MVPTTQIMLRARLRQWLGRIHNIKRRRFCVAALLMKIVTTLWGRFLRLLRAVTALWGRSL
eukprot:3915559-Karenia_brevis.AAC.1